MNTKKYWVQLNFTEDLLGVIPRNPSVYATWLELRKRAQADEEPPDVVDENSWTGFHSDDHGLYLMNYHIKGFFKEAASVNLLLQGKKAPLGAISARNRLDNWLFVSPRRIYLGKRDPDGVLERPVRCRTAQGDRIAIIRSDYCSKGTKISFRLDVLNNLIPRDVLVEWLDYGALKGLGQWRNGGYGSFTYALRDWDSLSDTEQYECLSGQH